MLRRIGQCIDLGVIFQSNLKFNLHVEGVIQKAYKTLGFVFRYCKKFNTARLLICLYNAYIRSKLGAGMIVCGEVNITTKKRIESIERRMLEYANFIVNGYHPVRSSDCSQLYVNFGIDKLDVRRKCNISTFCIELLKGLIDAEELLIALPPLVEGRARYNSRKLYLNVVKKKD